MTCGIYVFHFSRPLRNLSSLLKPAAMTSFPTIRILLGVIPIHIASISRSHNTRTRGRSKYPRSHSRYHSQLQLVSLVAAADIPGGGELYLTAGERSVTRGRQHTHVSSPEGANSIRKREGGRKPLLIIHFPFSITHYPLLPTFAPFGDAHTGGASIRRLRSLRSLTRG